MFNDLLCFITFFVNYFVYVFVLDKSWRPVTALGTKASFVYAAAFCCILYVFCTEYESLPQKLLFYLFLYLCVISFTSRTVVAR